MISVIGNIFGPPIGNVYESRVNLSGPALVGFVVGIAVHWCFIYPAESVSLQIDPETIQYILFVCGTFVILALSSNNFFRGVWAQRMLVTIASMSATLIYGNAVELQWTNPIPSYFLLGGVIPSSDAESWLMGGWRLLEQGRLSFADQIRPINAALHAFRLVVSGEYQASLVLAALTAGGASIFSAMMIRQSLGWIAAAVFFVFSFLLVRDHLNLATTEIHGYIFGVLAFGLLWGSAVHRSILFFSLGLALLSIGLNARTGPFFVLPSILIWGLIFFSSNTRQMIQASVWGVLGILSGFMLSKLFIVFWGFDVPMLYSNFAYTLYGMSTGGNKWTQVIVDYPHIVDIPYGAERVREIYRLAIQVIQQDPFLLISYYCKQLWFFLASFMKYDLVKMPSVALYHVYQAATVVAGCWIIARWKEPLAQLGILMFLGVLFSAPFLMHDAGIRAFASIYPMFAVIPALTVGFFAQQFDFQGREEKTLGVLVQKPLWHISLIGICTLVIVSIGPVIAVNAYQQPILNSEKCPTDPGSLILRGENAISVNIFDDQSLKSTKVPNIRRTDFFEKFPNSRRAHRVEFESETLPFSIILTRETGLLVVNKPVFIRRGVDTVVCLDNNVKGGFRRGYLPPRLDE